MRVDELISPEDVMLDVRAWDKRSALRTLATHLATRLNLDAEAVTRALAATIMGSVCRGC
jgi:hypothetical protein